MKLPIEEWLEKQLFDSEAIGLFKESIICYKAGAYRAGLLFSYLGAQWVIKQRIHEANIPDNVQEFYWNDINNDLLNDDKWESTVWEALITKKHGEIFNIGGGHLKTQLEYWKGIRNDCAHAKDNEIISAHVEAYWAFLKSNLPKLVVLGGKASLLNRISRHFDKNYTPKNANPRSIIEDLKQSVKKEELQVFFEQAYENMKQVDYLYSMGLDKNTVLNFWFTVLKVEDELGEECVKYLKTNEFLLYPLLDRYPQIVVYFHDPEFIRKLWHKEINKFSRPLDILAAMLNFNLIEETQQNEAFFKVIGEANDQVPDEITEYTLKEYKYFEVFKEVVFGNSNNLINSFSWANSKPLIVNYYLETFGLDSIIVDTITNVYKNQPYPNKMRANLAMLFDENEVLRNEFIRIAEEIDIIPPEDLGFVTT